MDHVIAVNPYLNAEGQIEPEDEQKLLDAEAKRQEEQRVELERQLEVDRARVEESNRKAAEEVEEERRRQEVENAEAREARDYGEVLSENNLKHVRQANEAPENYVDPPADINVTDNDVHNDGDLDGEFGRVQQIEQPSLDEIIAHEEEERQAAIVARYEVMDTPSGVEAPEGFVLPPAPNTEE